MSVMKLLTTCLFVVVLLFSGCASSTTPAGADPLSGKWSGKWGPSPDRQTEVVLELKWDGTTLKGTVNPGGRAADLIKASFNPQTNAITMDLDVQDNRGEADHYSIQGKVDGKKMSGTWTRNNGKGDFKISKD